MHVIYMTLSKVVIEKTKRIIFGERVRFLQYLDNYNWEKKYESGRVLKCKCKSDIYRFGNRDFVDRKLMTKF